MKFVEMENLSVTYPGRGKPSLRVDRLEIEEGESVLVVGKSGSGKSTLVNAINGVIPNLIRAEVSGEVLVYGLDVDRTPLREISSVVGTLLQDPESQVFNFRVVDEVAFGPENLMLPRDEISRRVQDAMRFTGISHLAEMDVRSLSGGELQRTALASILSLNPKALILDEPTSNIDPLGTRQIFTLLKAFREERRSMIIVEHKVERVLPYVDRVIVVDQGRLELDLHRDEIVEFSEELLKRGVDVPDHFLYLRRAGAKNIDRELLKGYRPPSTTRRRGDEEVLYSKVRVETREGRTLVDAELSLRRGEIVALMGMNGAGKSSLLKAIVGVLDRKLRVEARVLVNGKDISNYHIVDRGRYVTYLPQNFDLMFVKGKVRDEIAFTMKNHKTFSEESLGKLLKLFHLEGIKEEDPMTLSMGQRRRVAMASVLASGAKIVLMDEPTSGQDWYHKSALGEELHSLRELGYSFLVVTHDSRFVDRFCDYIQVMREGKIVKGGTPEEIFLSKEELGIYPPSEYEVMEDAD
ncbi:ATP-binding cassette domain-containing protein [Metallosphaera tengchongensis]|uniref:ATP-binding cassette domain-containing protein n=1 Tax=Metallosphaera tengchongensis TaxID=1532350 RepID=A0A6N0NQN5_9CREN|nr:ABC transporter ATP-binding protein [Metallosphaera tengchongensis]QKQ99001.1 ATP-binding cassette domain-containing protein [Metallosphaera tengchongensis]